MPAYGGTLAAARCLGERGVPVTMAGDDVLAPARWSRYVTRWERCPPVLELEPFFDWLLAFGKRERRHVLYPTCDDLAWLLAERSSILSEYFDLYQPNVDAVWRLLDKRSLYELSEKVGIATLPTAYPKDEAEARALAREIGYPLLLKPRTQVYLPTRCKGLFCDSDAELRTEYARFESGNAFHPPLMQRSPGLELPMLQGFCSDAAENIYSISGFIGPREGQVAARAAVKVMQRPRRLGVGLCFEEAPVDPSVLQGLVRLCREVGYYGVFEAEFVRRGDVCHLIDFNPRFYGQMGFETARGLPLAHLVWLGALGETTALDAALARANEFKPGQGYVYCNQFFFRALLSLQRIGGRMTRAEADHWRDWFRTASERSVAFDSIDAPADHMPAVVSVAGEVYWAARHPRSFLKQMVIGP